MKLDTNDTGRLLNSMLDIGELMLFSGAEVSRVEDSLNRIGKAYGAAETESFVITSSIVLTAKFEDVGIVTQTRRIPSGAGNNFARLEAFNKLSRDICREVPPLDVLAERIDEASKVQPSVIRLYAGSILAAGAFAVFFGGSAMDGLAAAVIGALVCFMQNKVSDFLPGAFCDMMVSFLSGLVIIAVCGFVPGLDSGMIMIGDIMLLIPGVSITFAVRDTLVGETISGAMKLIECLVRAAAIAGGFMLAIMIMGGLA